MLAGSLTPKWIAFAQQESRPSADASLSALGLHAQSPSAAEGKPAFDVASVKRNADPDGPHVFQALAGGRVNLLNQTVRELIYSAYRTQDHQIIGGPDWLNADRFDIAAKAEGNAPPPQMLP